MLPNDQTDSFYNSVDIRTTKGNIAPSFPLRDVSASSLGEVLCLCLSGPTSQPCLFPASLPTSNRSSKLFPRPFWSFKLLQLCRNTVTDRLPCTLCLALSVPSCLQSQQNSASRACLTASNGHVTADKGLNSCIQLLTAACFSFCSETTLLFFLIPSLSLSFDDLHTLLCIASLSSSP